MKHRNSHLLIGYWNQLRRGRDVPDQADIEPRGIKRILSHVFILEASDPDRPFYRLAGTSHCNRYDAELKGTDFLARWLPESQSAVTAMVRQAIALRSPICLTSLAGNDDGAFAQIETVLAPLTFGGERPSRFIGIAQVVGDNGVLLGKPITFERLVGSERVQETSPKDASDDDRRPPASGLPPMISKKTHLRLVVSREKPAAGPCQMDAAMLRLIEALQIATGGTLRAVS